MDDTIGPRAIALPAGLAELWRYRELLRRLIARNLMVKYQRSVLGFLWTLLNPLLGVAVLVLVFGRVVRLDVPQYWAFLISGYFVWNFLSQMLSTATYVLAEHAAMRRAAAFPSEVMVLGSTAARLVEFGAELALVLVALALFRHGGVPASWALIPVLLLLQVMLAVGLVFPLATLSAFYTDVQHALPIGVTLLFYLSPVFYPATMVPEAARSLYLLNPIAALITLYHTVLYEGRIPPASLLVGTAAATTLILVGGYWVFHRVRAVLPEVV